MRYSHTDLQIGDLVVRLLQAFVCAAVLFRHSTGLLNQVGDHALHLLSRARGLQGAIDTFQSFPVPLRLGTGFLQDFGSFHDRTF